MLRAAVTVNNRLGLHARAAVQLVKLVSSFHSNVTLSHPDSGRAADARSILSLLNLAAINGTVLYVETNGEDEASTLEAVKVLFAQGFNEK